MSILSFRWKPSTSRSATIPYCKVAQLAVDCVDGCMGAVAELEHNAPSSIFGILISSPRRPAQETNLCWKALDARNAVPRLGGKGQRPSNSCAWSTSDLSEVKKTVNAPPSFCIVCPEEPREFCALVSSANPAVPHFVFFGSTG